MRMKAIYYLSPSRLIDTLVSILKQVLSEKLGNRIHILKTVEAVHEHIPKEILPKDYGGNEKILADLHGKTVLIKLWYLTNFRCNVNLFYFRVSDDWVEELSSIEFTKYREEMNKACTDETLRSVDTFNEQYIGMPGTFRTLNVD